MKDFRKILAIAFVAIIAIIANANGMNWGFTQGEPFIGWVSLINLLMEGTAIFFGGKYLMREDE